MKAYFNSEVKEIAANHVVLATPEGEVSLANDWVFAMTGYHPDFSFLQRLGIQFRGDADKKPVVNPKTLKSNVPGFTSRGYRGGYADQRDFHRKWALSPTGDRRGPEREAEAIEPLPPDVAAGRAPGNAVRSGSFLADERYGTASEFVVSSDDFQLLLLHHFGDSLSMPG